MKVEMDSTTFTEDKGSSEIVTNAPEPLDPQFGMNQLHVIMVCFLGLIGVAGNALTLMVFRQNRSFGSRWDRPMVQLQAATDLLCSLVLILQEGFAFGLTKMFSYPRSILLCKLIGSGLPFGTSLYCSMVSLLALTINRYVHTVHPNRTRSCWDNWKKWLGIFIAMASGIPFVAILFFRTHGFDGPLCVRLDARTQNMQRIIVRVLVFYFLPVILLIFCYTRTFVVLSKRHRALSIQPWGLSKHQQLKANKMEHNIALTFAFVCFSFFLSQTIINFLLIIQLFLRTLTKNRTVNYLMVSFTCCTNPIIYGFKYKGFWQRVKRLFCRRNINTVHPRFGLRK